MAKVKTKEKAKKPDKVKPKADPKKPAAKKKTATAATVKTPLPKPSGPARIVAAVTTGEPRDVFGLVAQCHKLYRDAEDGRKLEACSLFPVVSAVVAGYGAGLCIPTAKAVGPLTEFRNWFQPPTPAFQPVRVGTAEEPMPWEPVPEGIVRHMDGTNPNAGPATWQANGIMWHWEPGFTEPKNTGETAPGPDTVVVLADCAARGLGPEGDPPTKGELAEVPTTAPITDTVPDDADDPLNLDGLADTEPTDEELVADEERAALEAEEEQRESEEAEAARADAK